MSKFQKLAEKLSTTTGRQCTVQFWELVSALKEEQYEKLIQVFPRNVIHNILRYKNKYMVVEANADGEEKADLFITTFGLDLSKFYYYMLYDLICFPESSKETLVFNDYVLKSGLDIQAISRATGKSSSTVKRYLYEHVKSPEYQAVFDFLATVTHSNIKQTLITEIGALEKELPSLNSIDCSWKYEQFYNKVKELVGV